MKHHCGILAIVQSTPLSFVHVASALQKLQHRGYESAGIAYTHPQAHRVQVHKELGLVKDVMPSLCKTNPYATAAIGHVRYSTVPKHTRREAQLAESQPLLDSDAGFALAHNGNVPTIRNIIQATSLSIEFNSDTVALVALLRHYLDEAHHDWPTALATFMKCVVGSYCLAVLTADAVYVLRDRYGIRPLFLAHDPEHGVTMATSETVALPERLRPLAKPVPRGHVLKLVANQPPRIVYRQVELPRAAFCSFESIYFMHYQSDTVAAQRNALGFALGQMETNPIKTDAIVVCVPKTAIPGAEGYAKAIGRPFLLDAIERRKDVNRTFILPTREQRQRACDAKFVYQVEALRGKTVYLVDDSVVRGTTMRSVVARLRECGARTIHARIPAPVIRAPCYFGIDMATREEMIASPNLDEPAIAARLGVDTIRYLSLNTMKTILEQYNDSVCTSCFTGKYQRDLIDW